MKKFSNPILLSLISGGLGLLCLAARLWLLRTGVDNKGLLVPGHAGSILSYVLAGLLLLMLAAALFAGPQRFTFRANRFSGLSAIVSVSALVITALRMFSVAHSTPLTLITGLLAVLSALCGILLGIFRFAEKRAWLPLYLPVIIALMLQFLYCFQLWGAESQLQRYFFSLAAQVFVLLAVYCRAAAECKLNTYRRYILFSCAAIFFGLAAAADNGISITYGLWALCILLDNLSIRLRSQGVKHS